MRDHLRATPTPTRADEDLIKYAWPQDVWFHVDKLSSAHVYLRMPPSTEQIIVGDDGEFIHLVFEVC